MWTAAFPQPHYFSPHSSTQVGIENLSVRFPQSNYSGHLQEDGYNWLVIGCVCLCMLGLRVHGVYDWLSSRGCAHACAWGGGYTWLVIGCVAVHGSAWLGEECC